MSIRQFCCLTGVAAAALLMSACGDGDDSPESSAGTSSASPAASSVSGSSSSEATPSGDDASSPSETEPSSASASPTEPAESRAPRSPSPEPSSEGPERSSAASSDPGGGQAERSDRGYLMKEIGEESYINDSTGTPAVSFALTDVVADPVCSAPYAEASENGHLVRLDIDLETGSAESLEEVLYSDSYYLSSSDWKFVDSEGVRANTTDTVASWMCLDTSEQFPVDIGPHERIRGSIVLDLPSASGTLIYTQPLIDDGWEWTIGQ
ncbi:hypothetical protein [Rothia halotolerans]|uniref:hypothetical protein n=1 Tax=Rothia halotolerans TaxID=405770 RepID=UPI00101D0FA9|nr:hypothetical protein [Rothia halotolerans]